MIKLLCFLEKEKKAYMGSSMIELLCFVEKEKKAIPILTKKHKMLY